jgi:hypothetical protein
MKKFRKKAGNLQNWAKKPKSRGKTQKTWVEAALPHSRINASTH